MPTPRPFLLLPPLHFPLALGLLLHLEPSDLPKRYASTQRAGAGGAVDVKHKAREATPQEAAAAEAEAEAEASAAAAAHAAAAAESRRRQEAEQAAAVKAAEEAKAKEEAQRRAWIMQYAEAGSSSEEEEEEVESDAQVRPGEAHGRVAGWHSAGCRCAERTDIGA